jgi:hypothetical protein
MLFFQMGWGGEFTATSMIGWIALAGIIVRNSILLVDFSVHRIQQGDSVVDAVISACKTRTRPILITALALVAGSSVIFFDPIFQGMAISLASGVLVSTILTLIVIPLGCVAAADALCSVAGSSKCRKFSRGLGPDDDPDGGPSGPQGPKRGPRVGDPLWVRAWGGFATVMFAVIGGVMALVGAVGGLLARRRKPASGQVSATPRSPAVSANAAAPSTTPTPETQRSDTPGAAAAVTKQAEARPAPTERSVAPVSKKPAAKKRPAKTASDADSAKAADERPAARKTAAKKTVAKAAAPKKATAKKVAAKKAATKKAAAKKAVAKKAAPKKVAAKPSDQTGDKAAPAASKPTASRSPGLKVVASADKSAEGAAPASSGRKKAGGRRGIQLKSLGKSGGDGLN